MTSRLFVASTAVSTSTASYRQFEVDRKAFSNHYNAKSLTDGRTFYAENSTLSPGKPDITLHEGNEKSGRIHAVCKFGNWSSDMSVCLGDPENEPANWDAVRKGNLFKAIDYTWNTTYGGTERSLMWKKTKSETPHDKVTGSRNFKLVDPQTGDVLAVFRSSRGWSSVGTLEIRADFGEDFDMVVLVLTMAMYEKLYRRSPSSSGMGAPGVGVGLGSSAC